MTAKSSSFEKILSIFLSVLLLFYSLVPLSLTAFVSAEETEDQSTQSSEQNQDSNTTQTPVEEPTPTDAVEPTQPPTDTPAPSPEISPSPTVELSPSPIPPTPTPTMTPDEYDAWKEQKRLLDEQEEQREDEWEINEEDEVWVTQHGGEENYFTSGQWEEDQKKAQEQSSIPSGSSVGVDSTDVSSISTGSQDSISSAPSGSGVSGSCENSSPDQAQSNDTSSIAVDPSGEGTNTATSTDIDSTNVSNNNCADLYNNSTASGNSGTNAQQQNDGGVSMATGNVDSEGKLINNANHNVTETDSLNSGSGSADSSANNSFANGSDAENLNTGEDSENVAVATQNDTLTVDNTNNVYANNQMTVEGTSGNNTLTENDGDVTLSTGDIELIANMLNILNLNVTGDDFLHLIVNIFGELNGTLDLDDIAGYLGYADDDALEVIARNENTGGDSTNTATAEKTETTNISNTNNAEVNNEITITATSGENEISQNDGTASVITGRIQVLANLLNFINTNFSGDKWQFIMINIFGSLTGNIIVPSTDSYLADSGGGNVLAENIQAGDDSTSVSTATSTQTTTITNTNGVELTNTVNANGTSGGNDQSYNDGPAKTNTGTVDVATNILNFLNLNISGNNWVFLIVNVFGKWMGQIVGFAGNDPLNAPTEGTFAALQVGGSSGTTTNTSPLQGGSGSTNTTTATLTTDTTVQNSNTAKVNNAMSIDATSGNNNLDLNDGSTSLTTGWVEIDANMLNIINMNMTGNNWLVVFLNVFGDFIGNLSFGPLPTPPVPPVLDQNTSKEGIGGIGGGTTQDQSNNNSNDNNNENTTNNNSQNNQTSTSAVSQGSAGETQQKKTIFGTRKTKKAIGKSNKNLLAKLVFKEDASPKTTTSPMIENEQSFFTSKLKTLHSILLKIISFMQNFYVSIAGQEKEVTHG